MARHPRIKTSPPNRLERRRVRSTGRRDALSSPSPTSPFRRRHANDRRVIVGRNDATFHEIAVVAYPNAHNRDFAATQRANEEALLVGLEAARAAAGPAARAIGEFLFAHALLLFVALVDIAGAMILMQQVEMPLGLPPNYTRWAGAIALGCMMAFLPAWAARSYEDWRLRMHSDDGDERRAAAAISDEVLWRSVGLVLISVAVVGLIGYARATMPPSSPASIFGSAIPQIGWQALITLGLVGIAVAFVVECYLASRRGAHDAHRAVYACRFRRGRASHQLRRADRRLQEQTANWTNLRTVERDALGGLSDRNRILEDAWLAGVTPLNATIVRPEPVPELEPAPIRDTVTMQGRESVQDFEHAAALLLWSVDPYAVVLPRRDLPPVLARSRQLMGVGEARGG